MQRESNTELALSPPEPADVDADRNPGLGYSYEEAPRRYRVVSASTLTGYPVRNSAGEELGKIEEIMLDPASGCIAFAVLSFGGFLGLGKRLFPIPWKALTLDTGDHRFILNVGKDKVQQAPTFDEDDWPNLTDPQWAAEIFGYYGHEPYWDDSKSTQPVPSSLRRAG